MKITIEDIEYSLVKMVVEALNKALNPPIIKMKSCMVEQPKEETCKWQKSWREGEGVFVFSPHMSHVSTREEYVITNPFCGRCGKKIEVVE